MEYNDHRVLLEGLYGRLARAGRGSESQRRFIVDQLCHALVLVYGASIAE